MFTVLAHEFCKWSVLSACQAVAVMFHLITNYVKYNKRGKSLEMTSFYRLILSGHRPIQTGRMSSQMLINLFDYTALRHLKILWVDFALAAQPLQASHPKTGDTSPQKPADQPTKGTAFLNVLSREQRCVCRVVSSAKDIWMQTDTVNFFSSVLIYEVFDQPQVVQA